MQYKFSNKLASLKPSAIREIFKSLSDPTIISLAAGNPAPESFPVKELARISADIFENSAVTALQYGMTEGYPALRDAVAKRLSDKFSIGKEFDSTVIVTGGQQGLELTCKAFCNEGDTVICENPTFIGALNAFRSNGANTVGVELEDDGINVEKLEQTIENTKNVKLLYLIPTFQNPSGITTSLEKRKKIYEIAKKHQIVIIEDNPYGELRFAGEEIPTIKSMDTEGLVVYCGSFSKILSAGMRVGFMCAPTEIISKAVVAKQVEDVHTNMFFQMLCHRYITECDLDRHIEGIRDIYRRKCTLMLKALEDYMPDCVKFTRPEGGLFIWCTLPEEIDLGEFVKAAIANKVAVVPGTAFNCDTEAPSNSFRLNYSTPSEEQITTGVKLLGETVKQFLAR